MIASVLATSIPPAVDTARQLLIAKSDRWFFWLVVSSIVVGVGVCLEWPEADTDVKRWHRRWKGLAVPPENEKSLARPASYLGLLLVILGVAGEGLFESLSSHAETALRAHDEQVLADTLSTASIAELDAASARQTTAQLNRETQALRDRADEAELELARLTAPLFKVAVLRGVANPNPMNGTRQRILVTGNTRINLPTAPKGKSVSWTLFVTQDGVGQHQFMFSPQISGFGNVLISPPGSSWVVNLVTDQSGTANTGLGGTFSPASPGTR